MPGGGWAAVATWVRNAEQGSNGLKLVSAEEARPGDIAAYDWGGENDFGADGHIGFLASEVKGGRFTALEGNNADAVNVVPRQLGGGANMVFIRVEGDAPGAPVAPPPVDAPAAAAPVAQPRAAAPAAGDKRASGLFAAARGGAAELAALDGQPEPAKPGKPGDSQLFLQSVQPEQPAAPAATPAPAAAPDLELPEIQGYPGDDAPREQLAAWMATQAKQRGLPPQLPVMASLVESGLKNLNFGDADSVGFFQMRLSIWSRDYPGYPDDPQKQVDWFLDQAEAVKAQRIARGQPVDDPSHFGEWIADVERPADARSTTPPTPPSAATSSAPSSPWCCRRTARALPGRGLHTGVGGRAARP